MEVLTTVLTVVITAASVVLAIVFAVLYLRRGFTSGGGVDDANRANAMLINQYKQVRVELDELKREVKVLRHWTLMLQEQVFRTGGVPVNEKDAAAAIGISIAPKEEAKPPNGWPVSDDAQFRAWLVDHFTDVELQVFAQDLRLVDAIHQNLPLDKYAGELVENARKRGQINQLQTMATSARPSAGRW